MDIFVVIRCNYYSNTKKPVGLLKYRKQNSKKQSATQESKSVKAKTTNRVILHHTLVCINTQNPKGLLQLLFPTFEYSPHTHTYTDTHLTFFTTREGVKTWSLCFVEAP